MKLNKTLPLIFVALFVFLVQVNNSQIVGETARTAAGSSNSANDSEAQRRLETFNIVWNTINDNYFDRSFSGLDWNKIKDEYRPKVIKASSDAELHKILEDMVLRLDRSHFGIIPPEVYEEFQKKKEEAKNKFPDEQEDTEIDDEKINTDEVLEEEDNNIYKYGPGIDLRFIDNKFIISEVKVDSYAAKAGIKIGYILDKVNGVSLSEFILAIKPYMGKGKSVEKQLALSLVNEVLNGLDETYVQLTVTDGNSKPSQVLVKREKIEGNFVKVLSNFPDSYLKFESKSVAENIGFIKFNHFALPVVEKFCNAITEHKDKEAIIIDLRGNLGGSFGTLIGITGLLIDKPIRIGTEISRDGIEPRFVSPHKKNYKGKILILVDSLSYSAAEIFAAALQENNKAKVIGEVSAGEALPSLTKVLPTGAVFMFPVANFKTPKGNVIEGVGVKPDLNVSLNRNLLLSGKDNQLDAAIKVINQNVFSKTDKNKRATKRPPKIAAGAPTPPPPPRPKKIRRKRELRKNYDAQALSIIDEYVKAIGGKENIDSIQNYSAYGKIALSNSGALIEGKGSINWSSPNKFAEIYSIDSVGEVKEVFNGNQYFMQTQVTGADEITNQLYLTDKKLAANFKEFINIKEIYRQITYSGAYDFEGKSLHLVDVMTPEGFNVTFGFDSKTKLLVRRTSRFSDITYGDYRKVGNILFPFSIKRGKVVEYKFISVQTNIKLSEAIFNKEENCFDKVD